jgi:hypothetical protein
VSFEIKGISNMMNKLKDIMETHPEAVEAGLFAVGNNIMTVAKERVPVDLGALRASGYVSEPQREGGSVVVELGFGGAAAAYAVRQHEDLSLNHPGGGQAKFLESALDEARPSLASKVATVAKRQIEGGA